MTGLAGEFIDRSVLRASGPDARGWLQDLVSNDVARLGAEPAIYAALLTPQGKYLFDFFLISDGPQDVLIDVAAERAEALRKRLSMYLLRRDARLEQEPDMRVARLWGGSAAPRDGVRIVADPRAEALGSRAYFTDFSGDITELGAEPAAAGAFDALRVRHIVPETGAELIAEESYILECGFERLHGVDFRKGCYVGQEVTARMRHKSELRKGLARVTLEGEAAPGTPVATEEGRPVGTLHTVAGNEAIAHLRFDRAQGAMRAGEARLEMKERG